MKLKRGEWWLIFFNLAYIIAFSIYYFSIGNFEFLWYIIVIVFFFALIFTTIRKTNFDYFILWGLSLWGLMHMSGGGLTVNGEVLYRLILIPIIQSGELVILRFDQFVHFFGFGIATVAAHHILKPYLKNKVNWKVVYTLIALIGIGAGVLNEIVEFIAVVAISETGVGGYENTLLDLIFNSIGAIAGIIVIHFRRKISKI